jgi:hypothetical protein
MLSRANFELLLEEGVLSNDVVTKVAQENRRRSEINLKNQQASSFAVPLQQPPPPPRPSPKGVML